MCALVSPCRVAQIYLHSGLVSLNMPRCDVNSTASASLHRNDLEEQIEGVLLHPP